MNLALTIAAIILTAIGVNAVAIRLARHFSPTGGIIAMLGILTLAIAAGVSL